MDIRGKSVVRLLLIFFFACAMFSTRVVKGEFPALEKKIAPVIKKLAPEFENASVLVSIATDSRDHGWDLSSAVETEIVGQLRSCSVDANDDDHDERMGFLANRTGFSYDEWHSKACHDFLILANIEQKPGGWEISIVVHSAEDTAFKNRVTIPLDAGDVILKNNIPELNQNVLGYLKEREGQMIGKGNDSVAAVLAALREFKCRRFGVFTLGRELGPNEAVLPGDILYFANAGYLEPDASRPRRMSREFMVVSEILADRVFNVYYQPVQSARRDGIVGVESFDLSGVVSGKVIVYRPTLGDETQLPMTFGPLRKKVPEVDWSTNRPIDLLRFIDPRLDTVRGPWAMKNGQLWFGYERQNKLQIPVYVPSHYSLKFTATRNYGKHGVTVVTIVGGKQVVLTLDGFDGATSGIGLIDKKMEDKNETTINKQVFLDRQPVNIEIQVRDNRLTLIADGEILIAWSGNSSRLALHKIHTVPAKDWIHLGGYESDISISSLTIERIE